MKYANFSTLGRTSVNIGDYLQFIVTDYLYSLMNIDDSQIVRIGFHEVEAYNGEEVILPFCYSFIYFVKSNKISISDKIRPVFLAVTLSTIDAFGDVDKFLSDRFNHSYFMKHSPIGCRDEATYQAFKRHGIPAYINGCMTAVFPKLPQPSGEKVLFIDVPEALEPFIPKDLCNNREFSTQQYYFSDGEIKNYQNIFRFTHLKYQYYKQSAKMAVTSRLHVALPLTAFGIPVILTKDKADNRFSFIEAYIPIYDKDSYSQINWNPSVPDIEWVKKLLVTHAIGKIRGDMPKAQLKNIEDDLNHFFMSRNVKVKYQNSHNATHKNGGRFDEYADKYWNQHEQYKYVLWGAAENSAQYWKDHIETRYPNAKLTAMFDRYRKGEWSGIPFDTPDRLENMPDVCVIVCSVGAVNDALTVFKRLGIGKERYCIVSDRFIHET